MATSYQYYYTVLFLIFFDFPKVSSAATDCNSSAVSLCGQELPSGEEKKLIYDDVRRQTLCRKLGKFLACFEATGCHRRDDIRPMFKGLVDALNFTCTIANHQSDYNVACWRINGFTLSEQFCFEQAATKTTEMTCEKRSDVMSCLVKSIDKCCGSQSAQYANISMVKLYQPLLATQNCYLDFKKDVPLIESCQDESLSPPHSNTAAIVIVVVLVVVVVIAAVVVVILRRHGRVPWFRL